MKIQSLQANKRFSCIINMRKSRFVFNNSEDNIIRNLSINSFDYPKIMYYENVNYKLLSSFSQVLNISFDKVSLMLLTTVETWQNAHRVRALHACCFYQISTLHVHARTQIRLVPVVIQYKYYF